MPAPGTGSASTCWRSTASSGRWSAARGSPSGCSPTAERAYAAAHGAARRSTSRRASARRRRSPRRSRSRRGARTTSRSCGDRRARRGAAAGARRARARRARRRGRRLADALAGRWPAPWRSPDDALPALARAAARRRSSMRATDRWAIEERGDPVAGADGAGGRRPGRASSRAVAPAGPRRGRLRQGQQRRRRARRRAAAARGRARGRRAARVGAPASCSGDAARARSSGCPATPPRAVRAGARSHGAAVDRRRAARHRLRRRAARRRSRGGDRRDQRRRRAGRRRRRPERRRRLHRRGRGRGGRARIATATFHAAKPGLWIEPGKAHAGEVARRRHRHPATARPVEPRDRADRRRACWRRSRAAARRRRSSPAATCSSPAARAG